MSDPKPPPDDDDDYELELEPIDPEILAIERARGNHRTESVVERIDVDELYGDTGSYSDLTVDWSGLRHFRFTTQHLLVLTAVLAVVMTVFRLLNPGKAIVVIGAVLLAAGWYWASRLERRQQAERARRRAEFFGQAAAMEASDASLASSESLPRVPFKFAFSTKELLIATTAAAVVLALLRIMGADALSMALGIVALTGLAANAMGYDPPPQVVLGWWLLLVMYLAVGLLAYVSADESSARLRPDRISAPGISLAVCSEKFHGAVA
jgi:hypothetical protein